MPKHMHRFLEGPLSPPLTRYCDLIEVLKYFFQSIERFFKKRIFPGKGTKSRIMNNIYKFN